MTADQRTPSGDDADKIEAALQEVYALASGKRHWTMRVPPEDTDSDLIICAGLDVAKEARAAIDQATHRAESLREAALAVSQLWEGHAEDTEVFTHAMGALQELLGEAREG